jgi:hypothetical protein
MMKNKVIRYSILLLFFISIVSGYRILLLSLFYLVSTSLVEGSAYNEISPKKTGLIIRCAAGLLVLGAGTFLMIITLAQLPDSVYEAILAMGFIVLTMRIGASICHRSLSNLGDM